MLQAARPDAWTQQGLVIAAKVDHGMRLTVYEHMQGSCSQHAGVVPQLSHPQLEQGLLPSASSIRLETQAGLFSD